MSCRRVLRELVEYVDGGLEDGRREEIRRHLDKCNECGAAYEKLTLSHEALSSLESPELSEAASMRVIQAMRQESADTHKARPSLLRSKPAIAFAGTAAAVLVALAVVFGIYAGRQTGEEGATTTRTEVVEEAGEVEEASMPAVYAPGTEWGQEDVQKYLSGGAGADPEPVVLASDADYSAESLRQMCDELQVKKDFAANYTLADAVTLSKSFTDKVVDQAIKLGLDAPMIEAMIAYVSIGEPSLLPCYVELAKFAGQPAVMIGLSAPTRSGGDSSLSRMELWVLCPEKFSTDPNSSIIFFLEHKG